MKQINFYVDLCKCNSVFCLGTLVNAGIHEGNIFARAKYVCLCEIAEIKDETTDDDWEAPAAVAKKTTLLMVDSYIKFLSLFKDLIENPYYIEGCENLFFSTLEFAKTIYISNDFIDDKILEYMRILMYTLEDKQMKEYLASAIHAFKLEKIKMQGGEVVVASFTGKIFEA